MNKDAMNEGDILVEDPTPYIDKYLEKIKHEIDMRKKGKSQHKPAPKEIDDDIERKKINVAATATAKDDNLNERTYYSVHRFIISILGIKLG